MAKISWASKTEPRSKPPKCQLIGDGQPSPIGLPLGNRNRRTREMMKAAGVSLIIIGMLLGALDPAGHSGTFTLNNIALTTGGLIAGMGGILLGID